MANQQLSDLGNVIKEAYESQPDTNAFTDDFKAKLDGLTNFITVDTYQDALDIATGSSVKIILVKSSEINDNQPTMYIYVEGFNLFWVASVEL